FVPEYVAEEYGLGYDKSFRLNLGSYDRTAEVLISDAFMQEEVPDGTLTRSFTRRLDQCPPYGPVPTESHVSQSDCSCFGLGRVTPTPVSCIHIRLTWIGSPTE
ncbi:MAG: hypothetical protein IPP40_18460, partial [bacterium]|nr:hypothetical protein [bacterium]